MSVHEDLFKRYFPSTLVLESPRISLKPEHQEQYSVQFSSFDRHSKTTCGTAAYTEIDFDEKTVSIRWDWNDPEDADQGLIKNLKFLLLSYGFDVMKMEKITMINESSFLITRSQWPATREVFFPELI